MIFKVKRFNWGGDCRGILYIPTDEFTALGGQIHKYLLELDNKFTLSNSKDYMGTYVEISSREAQENSMLFESIINSLASNVKYKMYNCTKYFHTSGEESGVLFIKKILDKSCLQTHATVMKEKNVLANLLELMVRLTHNMSKFNSRVITATHNLKRNGSSALDLLHQLFPAYLIYTDKQSHDYMVFKQNKSQP